MIALNLVAVYGSLRAGLALPDGPDLRGRLLDRGSCTLPGVLYDLGDYPGLIPGAGLVVGELYELLDGAVLRELDAYEEHDPDRPERSEYVRRAVRLVEPQLDAWVYYFNREVDGRAQVAGGDWAVHLRSRRRR